MFEFINDPSVEGLPLVGDGHAAVAVRTKCGRAARWVPGGDVLSLAQFVGEAYVVIDGGLYRRDGVGGFSLVDTSKECVVFVPPAGEPLLLEPESFPRSFAQVLLVGNPLTTSSGADAAVVVDDAEAKKAAAEAKKAAAEAKKAAKEQAAAEAKAAAEVEAALQAAVEKKADA